MELPRFASEYPRLPPVIRPFRTPSRGAVKDIVTSFDKHGVVISSSGMSATVVMQWMQANERSFRLLYHAGYKCFIVTPESEDTVENLTLNMARDQVKDDPV